MRVMLVHFHRERLIDGHLADLSVDLMAHCFGPFDSHETAEAFDAEAPDDCFKISLPIVGPLVEDIARSIAAERVGLPDPRLN